MTRCSVYVLYLQARLRKSSLLPLQRQRSRRLPSPRLRRRWWQLLPRRLPSSAQAATHGVEERRLWLPHQVLQCLQELRVHLTAQTTQCPLSPLHPGDYQLASDDDNTQQVDISVLHSFDIVHLAAPLRFWNCSNLSAWQVAQPFLSPMTPCSSK